MKNCSIPMTHRITHTLRPLSLATLLGFSWFAQAQTVPFSTVYKFQRDEHGFIPGNFILGADQAFYGTTVYTSGGNGTIFRYSPTEGLTTLHTFTSAEGNQPGGGFAQVSDGSFYGTTGFGGLFGAGTFYHFDTNNQLTSLYSFSCQTDGCLPIYVLPKPDGTFYVTTTDDDFTGAGAIVQLDTQGRLAVVHDFNITDGGKPNRILLGVDGNYYGNTQYGGSDNSGTIYTIGADNTFTSLYSFIQPQDGYDVAALVQGSDGYFYGGTGNGGTITDQNQYGDGVLYRYSPTSGITVLHDLNRPTGASVLGPLLEGKDGNFYGTTYAGGSSTLCVPGCGVLFQLTPSGVYTVLHQFNFDDGAYPEGALVQASDGSFYGITPSGGNYETNGLVSGFGTIFHFQLPNGPIAPTNLAASSRIPGKIKLSWTAAPGAVTYNLYEGLPAAESTTPMLTGLTKTNTVLKGLDSKQTYCFTVAGVNANGVGLPSYEACVQGSRK